MMPPKFAEKPCTKCGGSGQRPNPAWLRARRLRSGLTLRAMSRRLQFSVVYLSDIERGRRDCTPKILTAYEALS